MAKLFWIYTHNFTHSGAPLVMASIARELAEAGWRDQLRIVSWGGLHDRRHSTLQQELALEGIQCHILDLHQKPPRISRGDRLLLNSLALPEVAIQQALGWLRNKQLDRLDWYCHEGNPADLLVCPTWLERIQVHLQEKTLQLRVPSIKTLSIYQAWLGITIDSLSVQVPKLQMNSYEYSQPILDFSELRFQLSGAVGYGNKGHIWILALLQEVFNQVPLNAPGLRPVQLQFLGIESGPYAALAREVCRQAKVILGDNFSWTTQQSHELTLEAMAKSNIAINCSMSETFSLVTAEAMALGQPILRNRTGGWDEQLKSLGNGFDLGDVSSTFKAEHVELFNRLRSSSDIPDQLLKNMSLKSKEISKKFKKASYSAWLLQL
jgi:glycosyltransferase involved in cell wall biosynthesis